MSAVAFKMQQHHGGLRSWAEGPSRPVLSSDCVDVWRVYLDEPSSTLFTASVLSPDELTRASLFRFEKDRLHFARCRSALRYLVSQYIDIPAAEIRFEYQPHGKPELADQQNPHGLGFNVSHSCGLALIAVSAGHRLGIDLEKIRADLDTAALAEHFFSVRERDALRTLPDYIQGPAFFASWTRKESFLKATGDGLSFPLADFSVTTRPDLDSVLEEVRGDSDAGKHWSLVDLGNIDGYCAAVAVEGAFSRLETYIPTLHLLP
jgi:4'-phosphopantetheinyl transferase